MSLLRNPSDAERSLGSSSHTLSRDSSQFMALYHFALGSPGIDPRLLSFEPYHHLDAAYVYEPIQGGVGRIMLKD